MYYELLYQKLKLLFYQNEDATLSINYQIQRLLCITNYHTDSYVDRKYSYTTKIIILPKPRCNFIN